MSDEETQSFAEAAEECIRDSAAEASRSPNDPKLMALVTALNGIAYALLSLAEGGWDEEDDEYGFSPEGN